MKILLKQQVRTAARVSLASFIILGTTGFSGCPSKNLQGRYLGEQIDSTGKFQVVAQVPNFIKVNHSKVLRFRVYKTLGTAPGEEYNLTVTNKKDIRLLAPAISDSEIPMAMEGRCAVSITSRPYVVACWRAGDIEIKVVGGNSEDFTLRLVKDDSLPPLKNRVGLGRPYTLDELMGRAKFLNYSVSQEAEKVYQSKLKMSEARGNLLPKVSIRSIIGVAGSFAGALGGDYLSVVGDALPFIFPNNWFQWKASKVLFQAERMSFASLRGNEMSAVEGLYYQIYRDQAVLALLDQQVEWMKATQAHLVIEEQAGTLPTGSAEYFGTSITLLERDRITLSTLIKNEYAQLDHAVALPPLNGISELKPINFPSLEKIQPLQAQDFYKDAQAHSYELKTLKHLLDASRFQTKEVWFKWLDPSGDGSLGFGTASSFRIAQSKEEEVRKKITETGSLIELKSAQIASEYNAALKSYANALEGISVTQKQLEWLRLRHISGDNTLDETAYVNQLMDLEFKMTGFQADRLTSIQGLMMSRAKLERLLLQGYYKDLEEGLPEDKTTLKEYERNRLGLQ